MRIPSGKTDQLIFFVALDSADLVTRKTGLSSFTVYRSRNGAAAVAYTTPIVAELSAANMPGVYSLAIDEDTTIAGGSDSEEYCVHITQASMAAVTRTIELYRRDTTSGQTTDLAAIKAKTDGLPSDPADASVVAGLIAAVETKVDDLPTNAELTTALGTADDAVLAQVALVKAKTDVLPSDPADHSVIVAATDAILTAVAAVPTANANADALLDRAAGVETNRTFRQAIRLILAACAGKASGLGTTTATYRDTNDSVDRIVATVDEDGNRSAVTLNVA